MDDLLALKRYDRSRDPEAFTHLVTAYQAMVYAACQRLLRNRADAEDATQETFLKLAKHAGAIRGNVAGWLYSCATNTSRDLARRETTRRRHHQAASRQHAAEARQNPSQLIAHLDEALAQLNDEDRELICGRYLAGKTQAELALSRGVSQSLISRRLRQAVQRLHRQLATLGCGLAATALAPALEAQAAAVTAPASLTPALAKIGLSGPGPLSPPFPGTSFMALSPLAKAACAATALCLTGGVALVASQPSSEPSATEVTVREMKTGQEIRIPPGTQKIQVISGRGGTPGASASDTPQGKDGVHEYTIQTHGGESLRIDADGGSGETVKINVE